ncbi:MAG: CHASE domain-containing protein [Ignavibacteria bacterium]
MSAGNSNQSHSVSDLIRTFLKNKTIRQPGRKQIWTALFLLTGGLLLTLTACLLLKTDIEKDAKTEFGLTCIELNNRISARLHTHAQLVRSEAAFFENSETVTQSEWQNFSAIQMIEKNSKGIQGAGYAAIIPQYSVKPAGKKEIYTPVTYITPSSDGNLQSFGYDMFSDPVCRQAMERSMDLNSAYLSKKIISRKSTTDRGTNKGIQADIFMCAPVYKRGMLKNAATLYRDGFLLHTG